MQNQTFMWNKYIKHGIVKIKDILDLKENGNFLNHNEINEIFYVGWILEMYCNKGKSFHHSGELYYTCANLLHNQLRWFHCIKRSNTWYIYYYLEIVYL